MWSSPVRVGTVHGSASSTGLVASSAGQCRGGLCVCICMCGLHTRAYPCPLAGTLTTCSYSLFIMYHLLPAVSCPLAGTRSWTRGVRRTVVRNAAVRRRACRGRAYCTHAEGMQRACRGRVEGVQRACRGHIEGVQTVARLSRRRARRSRAGDGGKCRGGAHLQG